MAAKPTATSRIRLRRVSPRAEKRGHPAQHSGGEPFVENEAAEAEGQKFACSSLRGA